MRIDPIDRALTLQKAYREYLYSTLPLADDALDRERRRVLGAEGILHREPMIERIARYEERDTLLEACRELGLGDDLAAFAHFGLFDEKRKLFPHQKEALGVVASRGQHLIVTTGTGSGKTECFLLPIFAALLEESRGAHSCRDAAVRALILYPLNALAEDQMVRLRRATESPEALHWLAEHRPGDRFTFGRYTSRTPLPGPPSDPRRRELATKRRELEAEASWPHTARAGGDVAEVWDRWSMQASPPDILVTNYSMLNVMLMRAIEAPIFDQTKEWLAGDPWRDGRAERPARVFHMVVDELHSYRGTQGSEVALLLRLLFRRLGIDSSSPQLRFLASSASLPSGDARRFLTRFFGTSEPDFEERFTIIGSAAQARDEARAEGLHAVVEGLAREVGHAADADLAAKLGRLTSAALLAALPEGKATPAGEFGRRLFGESSPEAERRLLSAVASATEETDDGPRPLAPLRLHLLFRHLQGLWACANPGCTAVEPGERSRGRRVGKLFGRPRLVCDCGSRVLDLLICRYCGETFLGGYRSQQADDEDAPQYLVHDQPLFERADLGAQLDQRSYDHYGIFWPIGAEAEMSRPLREHWKKRSDEARRAEARAADLRCAWVPAQLDPRSGEIRVIAIGANGRLFKVAGPLRQTAPAFPDYCPRCDAGNSGLTLAPIGRHATGFQRAVQALAAEAMRAMTGSNRRLLVFTDSRQDAAKLAAGVELDHYRDLVRQLVVRAMARLREWREVAVKVLDGQALSSGEANLFRSVQGDSGLADAVKNVRLGCASPQDLRDAERLRQTIGGPYPLVDLAVHVWGALLDLGCNPAGPSPLLQVVRDGVPWSSLLDPQDRRQRGNLSERERAFLAELRQACQNEVALTLFAHRKRSLEAMGIASVVPPGDHAASVPFFQVALRLMGEARRLEGWAERWRLGKDPEGLPRSFDRYLRRRGLSPDERRERKQQVLDGLLESGLVQDRGNIRLRESRLWVQPAGDWEWCCER
jgi:DEAD/DEAH box helicase domain-containing protein